jgi:hypothetical protein
VSRKWTIAIIIMILVVASLGYGVVRFLYLFERPSLGITRGSASQAESRAAGLYVGTYKPTRALISLRDLTVVHVPEAWVEHAWKPQLDLLLRDVRVVTAGYYLYIPLHPDDSTASHQIWPFKFGLHLDQREKQISRWPGIGYDPRLGFPVYLDELPETVTFTVVQKEHESDSWGDAVPVESIQFKRAF